LQVDLSKGEYYCSMPLTGGFGVAALAAMGIKGDSGHVMVILVS
jgi:hypothetical protein